MPIATKKQIRESVLETTQQHQSQIGNLVDDLINITIQEIGNPGWSNRKEKHHYWSWLKRKTTFTATSEDTVLERDVDKIAVMRQVDSPAKIEYVPDDIFYRELPNPTETGNPRMYRLWEIGGTSTKLASANTIKVVSSSSSDDAEYEVVVSGYVGGRLETETLTMNGTSEVAGSKTFDAREIFVSKSALFNGNLTVKDGDDNSLVVIGPEEISPRFKVVSLWPIPSSTTVYIEYYKKIKELNNDSEMPEFDPKWHHVVRIGTLTKVYEYLGKTDDKISTAAWYQKLVRAMVKEDISNPDFVEYMKSREIYKVPKVRLRLSEDVVS
jgi:hypothetical protein